MPWRSWFLAGILTFSPAIARTLVAQESPDSCPIDLLAGTMADGPSRFGGGGQLLLFTCDGTALDSLAIGRFDSLSFRAVTGESNSEAVMYVQTGWGTGAATFDAIVLRIRPDRFVPLWEGIYLDYFLDERVGGGVDSASISFPSSGHILREGTHQARRWSRARQDFVPTGKLSRFREQYRWDAGLQLFEAEGPAD